MTNPYCVPAEKYVSSPEKYRIGTLTYTKLGLVFLFLSLYIGVFAMATSAQVVPTLMPIFLGRMGLSNALIGVLIGTIPSMVGLAVNPFVSFRSDRTRSRFGRRIPFMLVGIPGVGCCLIAIGGLIGWAPEMADALKGWLTPAQFATASIAFFMVVMQIFTNLGLSVFFYLFTDVVPGLFIGRFMSLFILFNAAGGFFFGQVFMPLAERNIPLVFALEGAMMLGAFAFLFWRVREGKYPPPPSEPAGRNRLSGCRAFVRECYGSPFYLLVFTGFALNEVSTVCRGLFSSLYARSLGMSMAELGQVLSYGTLVCAAMSIPLSFIVDRCGPLRIYIGGAALIVGMNIWAFFFVRDPTTFLIASICAAIVYALQMSSQLPSYVMLFPKDRYGQFSAALNIFTVAMLAAGSYLGGCFIDWTGEYRYLFIWDAVFTSIALFVLSCVYVKWQRNRAAAAVAPPPEPVCPSGGAPEEMPEGI